MQKNNHEITKKRQAEMQTFGTATAIIFTFFIMPNYQPIWAKLTIQTTMIFTTYLTSAYLSQYIITEESLSKNWYPPLKK